MPRNGGEGHEKKRKCRFDAKRGNDGRTGRHPERHQRGVKAAGKKAYDARKAA
ncbi:MAG: hypothetical protein ACOX4V_08710 [Anaerovoracaceae bacterium]